ncbi:MAG: primosomal protein N' [Rhodospirillales bacterium]|nr:primosomal protein N' [Rhodospirillales bacterium]MDH3968357.1 primosomal protein N' [Rhodospirillales bacterium]
MPDRHTSAARTVPGSRKPPAGSASGPQDGRLSVLLPLPLDGPYDYAVSPGLELVPGDLVRVPLGSRELTGVVWDPGATGPGVAAERLKPVGARIDLPGLPEPERRFVDWVAGYTLAPPGAVLRMALSVPAAFEPPKPVTAYRLAGAEPEHQGLRLTPARRRVLAAAGEGPARPAADLARAAGVGSSVVKGLAAAGVLEAVALPPPAAFQAPDWRQPGPTLTTAQAAAAEELRGQATRGGFAVTLLDGVTGSGKTEVYFEALAAALAAGRQVLVLLPEIALSAQWLERFKRRFDAPPAEWHSDLTAVQRRRTWRAVALGEARVVVGARSALFLPYQDLGLIVVDEEHDTSFKQEDGVVYHARDMAVVRARLGDIPAVLVSATPSLETATNVEAGRYGRLRLPERHGSAGLPQVELVDLRRDSPPRLEGVGQSWLSPALRRALAETFEAGEQALLFLNRRGFAPLTLCRACGHRLQCPNCTAWLVEHRLAGRLECHHCGHRAALPRHCPDCGAEGSLAACGPGVERLAEEVKALFPDQATALMSSDSISGPAAAEALVRAVQQREIDLLIGTQIVAKGHHFPWLTLVGVIDGDLGLSGGDLRAAERTYQLLHQVAGRAGRAERPGRVLIQTYEPEHPVMQALASSAPDARDRFLEAEAEARLAAAMPPFARLAALILSDPDQRRVDEACRRLARARPRREGVEILGPAPAPLAVLRGRHRRRFLLRTRRDIAPQGVLRDWLASVDLPRQTRLQIDVDPYSFL